MEERRLVLEQHHTTLAKAGEYLKSEGAKTGEGTKADAGAQAIFRKRAIVDVRNALRGGQVVSESNAGFVKKADTGKKGISRIM